MDKISEEIKKREPVYLGILSAPFGLRLFQYEPSDERWKSIKQLLINFNNQLKKLIK